MINISIILLTPILNLWDSKMVLLISQIIHLEMVNQTIIFQNLPISIIYLMNVFQNKLLMTLINL